ncbi:MAG: beta-ketoacyl synthase N-terminal-like domain-containing protein [Acidobacteriota bacterium]
MSEPVVIVSLGACTSLGRDAWSSAAAVRAGLSGFTQHPFMVDGVGAPMHVAMAPWLDVRLNGVARLAALLMPAIDQALEPVAGHIQRDRTAIALGLPPPRPGVPPALTNPLMAQIAERHGSLFGSAAAFASGHAGALQAMQAGWTKLSQGALDACLIAGVDSYLEPDTLEWLEDQDQLHGAGPLNNAWGLVPGEAGAALMLMRASVAQAAGVPVLATVLGTGIAHEPHRIKTDSVCLGEGLTQALRAALGALPAGSLVSDLYGDMNGEPYRADEFGFAALRVKEHFEGVSDFIAPADCWGDVGAAGGVLHAMLATVAGYKGYAKGPLAMTWASSESGERAAALLATRMGA